MDQQTLRDLERRCIQEEPPPCRAACPLHVDARTLTGCIAAGDWAGAWRVLRRTMPLAPVLGRICDAPCETECKRTGAGGAIRIGALERACVQTPEPSAPRPLRPPDRDRSVAVCGSGLAGLTAAWDLARKGWRVEIFEPGGHLGAPLSGFDTELLPPQVVAAEAAAVGRLLRAVHLEADFGPSSAPADIRQRFDAVFLDLGVVAPGPWGTIDETSGLFTGGKDDSPVIQAAQGRWAATAIDRFLQEVSITAGREGEGPRGTRLFVNLDGVSLAQPVAMADPQAGFSPEEAVREAERCLQCQCLECVKVCAYLEHFKAYPRTYAREIYNNAAIVMGARQANRLINSCSLCGLCEEVCPEDFAMAELCLKARQHMVDRGRMPPSAHEFALLDMEFSLSDRFALARHAPGSDRSTHLFFPGCQLCASAPEQIRPVYDYLRRSLDGPVGLMLGCCGAPAHWAGRRALYEGVRADWQRQWETMGRPELILACATCLDMFGEHLPEVPVRSLWQVMADKPLPSAGASLVAGPLAVHDPCTTRRLPAVQQAVRRILAGYGMATVELDLGRERTECCGFGGLMQNANPPLAAETVQRRAQRSPHDYLAYCAMCRDNLASTGKRAVHLLDLYFPPAGATDPAARPRPGWSRRRDHREWLRRELLETLWHEEVDLMEDYRRLTLEMDAEVRERLESRRILIEDLQQVIHQAEATGQSLVHPDSGRIKAARRLGRVTFWVEYAPAGEDRYAVFNAYSHRMEVVR